VRRCPSPTWSAPKRRKRRKSSRNVTAAGMGAAVSSGGRVLVCAARYAEDQNAHIIEYEHDIPHVLTLRMSQRDGFGLPAYAQNKRKAQRHLLSAVEGHSSRRLLAAAAGTNVDVEIKVKSEKEATKAAANLTPSNINKELSAAGEF
jgi:hypothetical protein